MQVSDRSQLPAVIETMGSVGFPRALLTMLAPATGAEHCAAFRFGHDRIELLAAASADGGDSARIKGTRYVHDQLWRRDPTLETAIGARGCMAVQRVDPRMLQDRRLRDEIYLASGVAERLFVSGERGGWIYGLSLLRTESRGRFAAAAIRRLEADAGLLLALIARHAEIAQLQAPARLSNVTDIEIRLTEQYPALTPRECQVCARLLAGSTAAAAACELGIRTESAVTYRKRAYRRLRISSRHELYRAYLNEH